MDDSSEKTHERSAWDNRPSAENSHAKAEDQDDGISRAHARRQTMDYQESVPHMQSPGDPSGSSALNPISTENTLAGQREMRVFRPTDVPFDPRRINLPDDFYEPTSSDVKISHSSLSGTSRALTDAPLLTKKMRDIEQAKKMSRYKKLLIRVRLPDKTALQGTFKPSDTVKDILLFVSAALRNPRSVKFHLFVVPPKTVLKNPDATLWSLGFAPAAMIYFGLESGPNDSSTLLSDHALSLLEDTPAAGTPIYSSTAPPLGLEPSNVVSDVGPSSSTDAGLSAGKKVLKSSKGVPKWFKK